MPSKLTQPVPADFDLKRVVCSYGYFLLAPNVWDASRQRLWRPLWVSPDEFVVVSVSQKGGRGAPLAIQSRKTLTRAGREMVKRQTRRMLRVDEDLAAWRRRHPGARRRGFGRLFRSPTLFEDMVKTITGCNVTWRNTITMNRLLAERVGGGAFPSPAQLARVKPEELKKECRVGYRAERIVTLARRFDSGDLEEEWFERPERELEEVRAALLALDGFGPYAAANVLQLLGHYSHLPIDTETYRHFCHVTGRKRPKDDKKLDPLIRRRYDRVRPYQFLAFWYEIWRDYERRYGDAWTWDPETVGANFTASTLSKAPPWVKRAAAATPATRQRKPSAARRAGG